MSGVVLELPETAMAEIAERAAAIVLERIRADRPAGESEYLTLAEACAILRCKPQRIYDLRSQGRLSKFGNGSRARVSRAELGAFVAGETDAVAALALELVGAAPGALPARTRSRSRSGPKR